MLPYIDRWTWGYLYLLHFSKPLGNLKNRRGQANHYLGWSLEPEQRIDLHLSGRSGVPIVVAALEAGITLIPHILGPAVKDTEWYIKNRVKQTSHYCPDCCRASGRRCKALPCAAQLMLPLDVEFDDFPAMPVTRIDGYEIVIRRNWNETRAGLLLPSGHLDDELL